MAGPRLAAALARIEAATRLLEGLALAVPQAADPDLAQRHRRLRATTADALARLDRLIGEEG